MCWGPYAGCLGGKARLEVSSFCKLARARTPEKTPHSYCREPVQSGTGRFMHLGWKSCLPVESQASNLAKGLRNSHLFTDRSRSRAATTLERLGQKASKAHLSSGEFKAGARAKGMLPDWILQNRLQTSLSCGLRCYSGFTGWT